MIRGAGRSSCTRHFSDRHSREGGNPWTSGPVEEGAADIGHERQKLALRRASSSEDTQSASLRLLKTEGMPVRGFSELRRKPKKQKPALRRASGTTSRARSLDPRLRGDDVLTKPRAARAGQDVT